MVKVTHIITGLAPQGAETMLYKLVSQMDRSTFANELISLTDWHERCWDWQAASKQLDDSGVRVRALRMRRGILGPAQFLRLVEWI